MGSGQCITVMLKYLGPALGGSDISEEASFTYHVKNIHLFPFSYHFFILCVTF